MKRENILVVGILALSTLIFPNNLHARSFSETIDHPSGQVFEAINELLSADTRIHLIARDEINHAFRFRLVVDRPSEPTWSEHWDGIYVTLTVNPADSGKSVVNLTVDRIYPPFWQAGTVNRNSNRAHEEELFAKSFVVG